MPVRPPTTLALVALAGLLPGLVAATLATPPAHAQDAPARADGDTPAATAARAEVEAFVRAFAAAARTDDPAATDAFIDRDAMFERVLSSGAFEGVPDEVLAAVKATLGEFGAEGMFAALGDVEIRDIRLAADGLSAEVLVYGSAEDDLKTWDRWELVKKDGAWRMLDLEDSPVGIPVSAYVAAGLWEGLVGSGLLTDSEAGTVLQAVSRADDALELGQFDQAATWLESVADKTGSGQIERVRRLALARSRLEQGQPDDALAALDGGLETRDQTPAARLLRASILNATVERDAALAEIRAYLSRVGREPLGHLEEARALAALGRTDEARRAFALSLMDDPDDPDTVLEYGRVLPSDDKGKFRDALLAMTDPAGEADYMAWTLLDRGDDVTAAVLVGVLRELDPDSTDADYWQASILLQREKPAEAAQVLAGALTRLAGDPELWDFQALYMEAMVHAGKAVAAYTHLGRSLDAFDHLASLLQEDDAIDALDALVTARAKTHPDEFWTHYYRAQVAVARDDPDGAEEAYAAAARTAASEDDHELVRADRVENLVAAGRALHAYEHARPAWKTFDQAADLLFERKDDAGLTALVARHLMQAPNDPVGIYWRAQLHWLDGEYEAAADLLTKERDRIIAGRTTEAAVEYRLVRALTRAGRLVDALALARRSTHRDGDPYYEIFVHGFMDRPDEAAAAIETCLEQGYTLHGLYMDPEVVDALNRPSMKAVKERFHHDHDADD